MRKRISAIATASALAFLVSAPAAARGDMHRDMGRSAAMQHDARVHTGDLSSWKHHELKSGYSAERLIGMHVRDRRDRSIGEIDNLLMTRDGRVTGVVVSAGGILGVGETYYRVPWKDVRFDRNTNSVSVPISEDNVERFRWGAEHVNVAANELKIRDIMDDNIVLRDGLRYGDVDDIIVGKDGRVKALVVTSTLDGAVAQRYAFPYQGEIFFSADRNAFTLPYTREQVAGIPPLDYGELGIGGSMDWAAGGVIRGGDRRY